MSILELKNCSKRYPKFLLNDVSFELEPGMIMGFIGRNGAGKTTTLKGSIGLLHFDKGEVFTFGRPFKEDELENRQHIAFSLSDIPYFPDSKLKDLTKVTSRFYREWNQDTYDKLCERFELDQNKRIRELSTGMKVKYTLAIALSHNAKLLIFDEPTSGLDPVSRDEILDIFKSLVKTKERAILFSTHITSDLDKCATDITYIHKGEIVASTSKEKFIDHFKLVKGKKDQLIDEVISYKLEDDNFTGLIKTSEVSKLAKSVKLEVPDLETIMVYLERGKEDEEFTL